MQYSLASRSTDLLDSLYSETGRGIDWQDVLGRLVAFTDSRSARMLLTNLSADQVLSSVKVNIDDSEHRRYVDYYVNTCPWRLELAQKPKGQLYSTYLDFSCHQPAFYRTEFFNDWAGPQDIHHGICGTVFTMGAHKVQLLVQRTQGQGYYTREQLDEVNQFLPHLRQALRFEQITAELSGRTCASVMASEVRPLPFVLLDQQSKLVYVSPRGERLLRQSDMQCSNGQLMFREAAVEQRFRQAFERVLCSASALAAQEQVVQVRREQRAGFSCFLAPVYPAVNELSLWGRDAYVAVYIYDPEQVMAIDHGQLMRLFALTDSEARVAADIALGLDPQVIARRDGRSAHTVRAQLKAVFTKMRCNRQNQLAAMVLQSPAVKWLDS
ncbi:helix-turn-helix transcriptional regulator [Cellvibrio sp. PSBB023]|uniref:helix-turn-helix transcriptional regulator n=1 Tax=Cellvibrio sp. PSBB023 TaxID=1945512 RepID=UPI00098F15CD|nr:helix-turn-helix transcriptional regulator [Cellvibrio sp. PSBB023]AQT61506.1 hypothetical protein B0D95_16375 [Cellvibrio sp. PSBB023]